ncbi:tyrosine-type recombinase/integrase [Eggerthella timonensis]|uniref:tyrosine-type recombinase/integrase n=1 Tax=Eggerthella timonensis TaxID=1871008 RepID=UPI0015E128EB
MHQSADGVWWTRPYLGTDKVTHKPIRPYKRFPEARDEDEARTLAIEWLAGMSEFTELQIGPTVADMVGRYIGMLPVLGDYSPSTVETYRSSYECHVIPLLGDIRARELKPYHVTTAFQIMAIRGGKRGKPVDRASILKVHALLSGAYRWMVESHVCDVNPIASVPRPKPGPSMAVAYDEDEFGTICEALLAMMESDKTTRDNIARRNLAMASYVELNTGARLGEVCAQARADVRRRFCDFHVGHTMIERPNLRRKRMPKNASSVRNISVDDEVMGVADAHFAWQDGYLDDAGPKTPLVCTERATWMRPSTLSAQYTALRKSLGLPEGTTSHTLRHTHATWLIYEGADIKTIQGRLGHASINTTLNLYAHILPGADAAAARAFADARRRCVP